MKLVFLFFAFLSAFSAIAQDQDILVFKDGEQLIRLEFEDSQTYLELGKPTLMKVFIENIDPVKVAVVGRGIRRKYNPAEDPFSLWTVTVDETSVIEGNYKIIVGYGHNENGSRKMHNFYIPVKQ